MGDLSCIKGFIFLVAIAYLLGSLYGLFAMARDYDTRQVTYSRGWSKEGELPLPGRMDKHPQPYSTSPTRRFRRRGRG